MYKIDLIMYNIVSPKGAQGLKSKAPIVVKKLTRRCNLRFLLKRHEIITYITIILIIEIVK